MRHLIGALVLLAGVLWLPVPASATKYAALVMDANTGQILHARDADSHRYPASLTKMMTLFLVFEALEDGRLKPRQRIPVSASAAAQPPSKLGLRPGSSISVEDAILALVTKSANDIATAVAEELGGSERNFALMMTAEARKLGMSRTTFRNASGLPHQGQLTTARDMATLARAHLRYFPQYYHYFSVESFGYAGVEHRNHNRMLGSYDGLDGIKTGYIHASGFNLVASAKRNDRRLIGVVFGAKNPNRRGRLMANLLDEGFRTPSVTTLAEDAGPTPRPDGVTAFTTAEGAEEVDVADSGDDEATTFPSSGGADGAWGIQVGAYRLPQPARKIARVAYDAAAEYLGQGTVTVIRQDAANRRPYYLARIHGIGPNEAQQACRKLQRKGIDCMKLRLPVSAVGVTSPPRTVAATGGSWGVQVGAYPESATASSIARKAVDMVPELLEDGAVKIAPLTVGKRRPLYRARILGIDKQQAYEACRQLEAEDVPCMVLKSKNMETASAETERSARGSREQGSKGHGAVSAS
ncbi:MAG: D-alanyl-D-alanine carboxypeptidase [Rhodobacteraceae bacterium]|nr:D-alanyl-D-alanine carboxypeptidase [Paracoccaceae bacterium]